MHPAIADVLEPPAATGTKAVEPQASRQPPPPPKPPRRWLRRSLIASLVPLGLAGGVAGAAVGYDRSTDDKFLPGVQVAGMEVGGQEPAEVVRDVTARLHAEGDKKVSVTAGPAKVNPSLDDLGLHSDTAAVVDRAEADSRSMGTFRRVWHRLMDKPVNRSYPVRFRLDRGRATGVMANLAKDVDRPPVDAKINTSTGFVTIAPAVAGQEVDRTAGLDRLVEVGERMANGGAGGAVDVPVKTLQAKVTSFPDIILVRTNENRLYHYENGALARSYTVATGTSQYPTPKGRFQITLKRFRPTWVNPDPGGWGKGMPASIPPGPANPLGTRALNINAPGIRIHGTSNVASLGTAASHGCIRMSIPESEYLFEQVDVGTPVIIIPGPGAPPPQREAPSSTLTPVAAEGG